MFCLIDDKCKLVIAHHMTYVKMDKNITKNYMKKRYQVIGKMVLEAIASYKVVTLWWLIPRWKMTNYDMLPLCIFIHVLKAWYKFCIFLLFVLHSLWHDSTFSGQSRFFPLVVCSAQFSHGALSSSLSLHAFKSHAISNLLFCCSYCLQWHWPSSIC